MPPCDPQVPTFRANPLHPTCDDWCDFPVADRPNAVRQWLEAVARGEQELRGAWVLMLECDYVMFKPVPVGACWCGRMGGVGALAARWMAPPSLRLQSHGCCAMIQLAPARAGGWGLEAGVPSARKGRLPALHPHPHRPPLPPLPSCWGPSGLGARGAHTHARAPPPPSQAPDAYDPSASGLSFAFDYIDPVHPDCFQIIKRLYSGGDPHDVPNSGPAPVLMRYSDLYGVTPEWERITAAIEDDKEAVKVLGGWHLDHAAPWAAPRVCPAGVRLGGCALLRAARACSGHGHGQQQQQQKQQSFGQQQQQAHGQQQLPRPAHRPRQTPTLAQPSPPPSLPPLLQSGSARCTPGPLRWLSGRSSSPTRRRQRRR
jgi:hypothetical protein